MNDQVLKLLAGMDLNKPPHMLSRRHARIICKSFALLVVSQILRLHTNHGSQICLTLSRLAQEFIGHPSVLVLSQDSENTFEIASDKLSLRVPKATFLNK